MTNLLLKKELKKIYKNLPIKYSDYLSWLDGEKKDYYLISTMNYLLRNETEWNVKGREIYNKTRLKYHASCICEIIKTLKLTDFIVQHEYLPSTWFPKAVLSRKKINLSEKIKFIRSINPSIDLYKFDGVFIFKEEIFDFIEAFADYPFLLSYKSIDIISLNLDLIIKIGPHLSIDFVTLSPSLIKKIISLCDKLNLKYIISSAHKFL